MYGEKQPRFSTLVRGRIGFTISRRGRFFFFLISDSVESSRTSSKSNLSAFYFSIFYFLSLFFYSAFTNPVSLLSTRRDGHNATRRVSSPPRAARTRRFHSRITNVRRRRRRTTVSARPTTSKRYRTLAPARTPSHDNDLNRRKLHALPCSRFTGEFHGSPCAPRPRATPSRRRNSRVHAVAENRRATSTRMGGDRYSFIYFFFPRFEFYRFQKNPLYHFQPSPTVCLPPPPQLLAIFRHTQQR